MAFPVGAGGNPRFGRDTGGSLPPGNAGSQQPYGPYAYPLGGGPARYGPPGYPQMAAAAVPPALYGMPPPYVPNGYSALYGAPPVAMQPPMATAAAFPPGYGAGAGRGQGPAPQHDPDFRTCSMRNSTGGYGCEPGYNYFFPSEHTKIHVLKTGATPPWQLPANFRIAFHACHVPVTTTGAELLRGFGARNPVPKKNVITEVCQGGAGKWYRGIELRGDNAAMLKKPIKDLGWDASRTGLRGQKKVVYVYVQRE